MQGHILRHQMDRRQILGAAGIGAAALVSAPAWAQTSVDFGVPGGPSTRPITTAYPQKGPMILQRASPPWLETPFDMLARDVFTPNDQHYVSWHWATFPSTIDVNTFHLAVRGRVNQTLSLSLDDILHGFPRVELAAVSQCAGNSRLYMVPRVPGAQWGNGSMSNALWTGVRLKDVLDRAGVKAGAVQVRFGGLDEPVIPEAPKFMKSLDIDHARDGEVMIAFGMNGEQLPLLNGFPLKLIVPGWSAVYWLKMLNDIEVLDRPDTNYWTTTGYRIPDAPHATIRPSHAGVKLVPVTRMPPRSFITNIHSDDTLPAGVPQQAHGFAFGGDSAVAGVDLSIDAGQSWQPTQLGSDQGKYGFRQWQASFTLPSPGAYSLLVRCTNRNGDTQPSTPVWNPAGYLDNTIERTRVVAS